MILSDKSILKKLASNQITIDPLTPGNIQPASVDLTLDNKFLIFRNHTSFLIDPLCRQDELTELVEVDPDRSDEFVLHPGEFVLGSTYERVRLPNDLVARIEGKSSLGRLGLMIHSTAGFIDPGFNGHITLELANVATLPIALVPGMKIGQISFMKMTSRAMNPYGSERLGSKYQGQRGPTASQYWKNYPNGSVKRP